MKTHASYLVMSDLMLHEFPQGDPYSGPAFADKHKSKGLGMIVGVVASIVTMGAAMPMLASGVLATQLAGGAMMAGGVMTGVGAVTGNKKLMKVGGILSLAGGLGNMAASAAGAGQAGSTGALAAGSGSEAISGMATKFMESANTLGLGEFYSADTIAAGEAAAGGAETAGGAMAQAAETAPSIQLAGESGGVASSTGQTLDLAKSELAAGAPQSGGSGLLSKGLGDAPMASGGPQVPPVKPKVEPSMFDKGLKFIKDNPEATKIGAGMLEKAMGSSAEDEKLQALTDYYKNQGALTLTQNEIAQYKLNNAGKQVAMIGADDPERDAKVKAATAKGIPISFIPSIGQNYTPVSKNFTPVARNATYNQPTA